MTGNRWTEADVPGRSGPYGLRGHSVRVRAGSAPHDAAVRARSRVEAERPTGTVYGL
ncbi:hypothetical protein ACSDR0_22700 [Streptosporangium sp. G11]|uniref:hypothetical protein n=1 Tax=Streptosporangium sp. G11 TaxID=3436926 RepID=UPI003EBED0B8